MAKTRLTWEEVSQYEPITHDGRIWRHKGIYYLVTEEGGIATQRVVYELPEDFYRLFKKGERTLGDIHTKLRTGNWPLTEEEQRANIKQAITERPITLVNTSNYYNLFTEEELEKLIPIAEKQWIDWKGKLPECYVSPLKNKTKED
ncbi:hypothetical protein [Streptococcus sp. CSL10205-OR2]|uniref:hypothetical protein n=1 Tax=Streptococcus sp. CSL10205-OR2 TaxID=2980558 RepID=UPI0021D80B2A|nr:hypothetical protein [Streptococcus sp. CSL10205-OR2]MCU9533523.1 hypothetical protein [Streptococcus sp. CSL10205-OR2]